MTQLSPVSLPFKTLCFIDQEMIFAAKLLLELSSRPVQNKLKVSRKSKGSHRDWGVGLSLERKFNDLKNKFNLIRNDLYLKTYGFITDALLDSKHVELMLLIKRLKGGTRKLKSIPPKQLAYALDMDLLKMKHAFESVNFWRDLEFKLNNENEIQKIYTRLLAFVR